MSDRVETATKDFARLNREIEKNSRAACPGSTCAEDHLGLAFSPGARVFDRSSALDGRIRYGRRPNAAHGELYVVDLDSGVTVERKLEDLIAVPIHSQPKGDRP